MPKITCISHDGESHVINAENGISLMEATAREGVAGIDADCGGACACATCHVYVADEWADIVGAPFSNENDMLDFASERKPNSRLSCQITVEDKLDGLVVHIPESQG